jgi:hypothetical protein
MKRTLPGIYFCLMFCYFLISCAAKQEINSAGIQRNTSKNDTTDSAVFDLTITLIPIHGGFPLIGNIKSVSAQSFDINTVVENAVSGQRELTLRYKFRNLDELQEVKDELIATGMVIKIYVTKNRFAD